jgi:sec-independent protein translocase protein TatA
MGVSLTQLLIILFVILVLFGAGKLPKVMGDLGRGLKSFRDEMKDEKNSKKKNK